MLLRVTGNKTFRWSAYEFLLAFHNNYVHILHHCWDIARYWSQIVDCNLPHLYLAPQLGWPPWHFAYLWHQKTNSPWSIVRCCLYDYRFNSLVKTPSYDRRTHDDSICRASKASRGKKKPLRIAVPLKYRQHAYRYTANGEGKWKEEKERRDGKG